MSFPLSTEQIRWWFRSRHSGHLNLLSYWLCIVFFSALLSLGFSSVWQAQSVKQSRLQQAFEASDWIYAQRPAVLQSYAYASKDSFLDKRSYLINRIQYGDSAKNKQQSPLYNAEQLWGSKNITLGKPGRLYDKPDIRIFPSFATYSKRLPGLKKSVALTEIEEEVFRNFAAYATELLDTDSPNKKVDLSHIEQALARALGLASDTIGGSSFNVPWIYVASKTGAIAVFPGTTVIAEPRWETTSRPWFAATLGGDSVLAKPGLDGKDQLTVTYLDILAKSPMLVRTYLYKFSVKSEEFVVGIDLHFPHADADASSSTASTPSQRLTNSAQLLGAVFDPNFRHIQFLTFSVTILLFLLLRWISSSRYVTITFTRSPKSLLGKIVIGEALSLHKEEQTTTQKRVILEGGKYVPINTEWSESEKRYLTGRTSGEKSRGNLRGLEQWQVAQSARTSWRLFWLRFESNKTVNIGTLQLIYSSDILPEAAWSNFNQRSFSESEVNNFRDELPTILKHNADRYKEHFEIPFPLANASSSLQLPPVPEWVRAVVDAKELLAVHQCRAYVSLSSTHLDEVYSKAEVKAVVLSSYFEQLLDYGQIDFWFKGKTISRLVSFPDKTATLNLTDKAREALHELFTKYSSLTSRSLKRVDLPISNDDTLLPVYDFSILDDVAVIVTHSISKVTVIDSVSGGQPNSTYYMKGYLSWRPADIAFYQSLFAELARQSDVFPKC